ncbi:hypothetical protein KJQ97_03170 [Campylobacter sp. 2018MI01]|uniref:hypothetical protein n=1 Tax=Campylobacter sp. 2018MI01 TaxID=2836735 RepID=UPI001BD9C0B7|nr:hypothetical protein [Campylobacter sp. 2018MI01]MBT0878420.1 hypothetical protein [Campylobacter sp. 2018MI01]
MFFRIVKLIFLISLLCLILALCYFALTYNFISNNTDPLEEFNELKSKLYRIEADRS